MKIRLSITIFVIFGQLLSSQDVDKKTFKYLQGSEELISFYAQEGPQKNKMILRKGILVRKENAPAIVLICHGFMCDKFDARCLRHLFNDYHTLTFDFRAHGEHITGQCCSFGRDEAYDVLGAAQFIKSDPGLKDLPIIIFGFSMGAVASILAYTQAPELFCGAIWDCPFESTHNLIGRGIEQLKMHFFGYEISLPEAIRVLIHRYAYHPWVQAIFKMALKTVSKMDATPIATCIARVSTEDVASHIKIPALFITCAYDDKTPVCAVRRIYDKAAGFKRLWITNGRHHFDSYFYNPEAYNYKVNKFIKEILNQSYKTKNTEKIIDDSQSDTLHENKTDKGI